VAISVPNHISRFLEVVRPEIRKLPRYNSGLSVEYVRAHYGVQEIAKLGSNENPYGPSPKVRKALEQAIPSVALYPEPSCDPLRSVLAHRLGVAPQRLVFGNGSEDLIAVIAHTFLSPHDLVVTFAPSFGLHVIWPQSVGARVRAVPVDERYNMNIDEVLTALTPDTRMLMFGNPSNPVGTSIGTVDLRRILAHLMPETLLVFDEAYLEYASADPTYPDFLAVLNECDLPWIMLRTLSKAYGLAGLRVGYGIASSPELIDLMDRVRAPFNVNRLAQVAAIAALDDMDYVKDVVARTIAQRERMRQTFDQMGFLCAPSLTNFLFVHALENAGELAERLLARGVIVKPWQEPGFTDHVRVSVGTPRQNDQLLSAWASVAH